MVRLHLVISGEVQGVGYRLSAREEAVQLGVAGWIRNLDSGEVEAEVEGPDGAVDDFVKWCWRGPRGADVSGVNLEKREYRGEFKGFGVLHS